MSSKHGPDVAKTREHPLAAPVMFILQAYLGVHKSDITLNPSMKRKMAQYIISIHPTTWEPKSKALPSI